MDPSEKDEFAFDQCNDEYAKTVAAFMSDKVPKPKIVFFSTCASQPSDRLVDFLLGEGYDISKGVIVDPVKLYSLEEAERILHDATHVLSGFTHEDFMHRDLIVKYDLFSTPEWNDPVQPAEEPRRPKNKPWYRDFDRKKRF